MAYRQSTIDELQMLWYKCVDIQCCGINVLIFNVVIYKGFDCVKMLGKSIDSVKSSGNG